VDVLESSVPESILWDDWHAIAEWETVAGMGRLGTVLFGRPLVVTLDGEGVMVAHAGGGALPGRLKYGYVWTCLGTPQRDIIDFPEAAETDRYVAPAGSIGIAVSGLRAVENFLDLAHLPFVHRGSLGDASVTEVPDYTVTVADDGVTVTDVRAYQPVASPTATEEMLVDYRYDVLRPYTVALRKTNPIQRSRFDALALMVQPVNEERCVLHMLDLYLKEGDRDESAREFTRFIQSQDKPILENQKPRRLPLDPRAEIPVRSDASSLAYRRWLRRHGVRYGAVPENKP
jgi:phenylpropionate dioxygenase-like ring-hydroxylating dioxygenase large terminal subunit